MKNCYIQAIALIMKRKTRSVQIQKEFHYEK